MTFRTVLVPVAILLGALVSLGGCGNTYAGSTVAQQVKSWTQTSPDPKFSQAVSTIQGDFHRVTGAQAQTGSEPKLLRTECDVLVTDALSANQNLPTPDAQLTGLLSRAYGSAAIAGQNCFCAAGGRPCPPGVSGSPAERPVLLERFATESATSERALIEAQARVDQMIEQAQGSGS